MQFDEHFANRVEVEDWYHAMERLWQVGNGIFGQGTQEAVRWVKQWEGELWEGRKGGNTQVRQVTRGDAGQEQPGTVGLQVGGIADIRLVRTMARDVR